MRASSHGGDGRRDVEFVGMEVVRRDWTALAKHVQRELYRRLFTDQPVDVYLAESCGACAAASSTTRSSTARTCARMPRSTPPRTPPHVAAARKSTQSAGRLVSYVMTTAGPEPLDNVEHPLDREHYVDKQVRPVAEPVLETLGLDFEQVIGDSRQFDMYSLFGEP